MPFISTKTTKTLNKETEKSLKEAYGKAIELLPGKTEKWLMLSFDGDAHMAFHGDMESDMAFLTVALVGAASDEAYAALTKRLCEIMTDILGIPADMVYIKYQEIDHWGFDGINF